MRTLPPQVIHWFSRGAGDEDCAVAAMALACGVSYATVLAETVREEPGVIGMGLTWKQMKAVVTGLGFEPRLRRKYDINEDTGILGVGRGRDEHAVYLWEGRVLDPSFNSPALWLDPEEYLSHCGWKAGMLLTVAKREGQ